MVEITNGPAPLFGRQVFVTLTDVHGNDSVPIDGTMTHGTAYQFFDHNIEFSVENTTGLDPNSATISIFNPTVSTAKRIQEAVFVELFAGYGKSVTDLTNRYASIFSGDIRRAVVSYDGPNTVVTLEAGDGEVAYEQELTRGYRKGTPLRRVLTDLMDVMGLEAGTGMFFLLQPIPNPDFMASLQPNLPFGITVGASAADTLDKLLDSIGYSYSIQKGVLTIHGKDKFTRVILKPSIREVINRDNGMVGSPSIDKDGTLEVSTLLNPLLVPGHLVKIKSQLEALYIEVLFDDYEIHRVVHSGGKFTGDFRTHVEGTQAAL